jgi:hypothetical protein
MLLLKTLFLLIAKNSQLGLKNLLTKAEVIMNVEGMEKLIFANVHFSMDVRLENAQNTKKSQHLYNMAQKICSLRQSWGENVPIRVKPNFK